jgi:hypothetical protein
MTSTAEFLSKCRFCLKDDEPVTSIEPEIYQLFHFVTGCELQDHEKLPSKACASCKSNLVIHFNFKKQLIEDQVTLQEVLIKEQYEKIQERNHSQRKQEMRFESRIQVERDHNYASSRALPTVVNVNKPELALKQKFPTTNNQAFQGPMTFKISGGSTSNQPAATTSGNRNVKVVELIRSPSGESVVLKLP